MCTAISTAINQHYFGRTLDVECSYGESVIVTPRRFPLRFCHAGRSDKHYSILGVAHVAGGVPLYYDGINEHGLCAAALRFADACSYSDNPVSSLRLAPFEVIPYILSSFRCVDEVRSALRSIAITDDAFSETMPNQPLHYMIADARGCIILEPMHGGVSIYDNVSRIMTNAPALTRQLDSLKNLGAPRFDDFSSEARFFRACYAAERMPSESARDVMRIMNTVSVPQGFVKGDGNAYHRTVYTAVMDSRNRSYTFVTEDSAIPFTVTLCNEASDADGIVIFPTSGFGREVRLN